MKRLIACMVALLSLSGCTAAQPVSNKIKIGVTVYDSYDTFISELMDNFDADMTNYSNITLQKYDASKTQSQQNKQVEKMIEDGCNVICVNLVDRTAPKKIIDLAKASDVPIIFFNRELVAEDLQQWSGLYYIGANAEESGVMEGKIAADAWKASAASDKNSDGIIQYVVMEGEAGHQDAIVRTEKSVNTLIDSGLQVDKLASPIANWNKSQAQTRMASLITQYRDSVEMVLCNNDDMALGVIDAYRAAGLSREQWPIIVGIDGTKPGLEAVASGEMAGTVYNNKEGQASAMADLAVALASKESTSSLNLEDGRYIRLAYEPITSSNVSEYIDQK
ncbi:MAG: galactose ABC transporter substrate-binding protein [Solobacterium sp.]|jgi:methyl-galactoside transport system substrate-binding protein|nr:galactose ABC transporter substrate-binding protein [Solobacterium sp.]MCH4206269.1 galactose ABC transporter substrate-binding protein [Solobacterium sp.]MCH4227700.1 galactose ABC transporter substrate-binding protein [Solobacterium sp.]MCH4283127.1 galactose ABC transporter substrate-binding protein [Solobacterium sp.]